jgi:aerobic carbon-monoxide dehydrogenase large subunit
MIVPPRPALARPVRHVGDPVAFVVADTAEQARDAAEAIEVAYDTLPAVTDAAAALGPARRCCGTRRPATSPSASRRATGGVAMPPSPAAHVVEIAW